METTKADFDALATDAVSHLQDFFRDDDTSSMQLSKARVAASVLSAWTRHKQTEGARDATNFMIARELARDKDELERYIRAALPDSRIVRILPAPSGGS